MLHRRFGAGGPRLSVLAFGPMRLLERGLDRAATVDLLLRLVDGGVDTFHSSREYDAHPLFCEALAAVRRLRPGLEPRHVVKLGVPHFDEAGFDAARLERLVEAELRALGAERLDVVQWLVRQTPNEDAGRLAVLAAGAEAAAAAAARLKAAGRIGAFACFPYSPAFAGAALAYPWIDGLVDYLNPHETAAVPLLDRLRAGGRGFVALRPFAAGRIREAATALGFALRHPAVACAVASLNTPAQVDAALAAVAGMERAAA